MDTLQLGQIAGALLILAAFVGAQLKFLTTASVSYLWLNLIGAAVLTVVAWLDQQWGFLLLEAVWTAVSAWSLATLWSSRLSA
jgi:hypothetical protein